QHDKPALNIPSLSDLDRPRCVGPRQRDNLAAGITAECRNEDCSAVIAADDSDADHDGVSAPLVISAWLICASMPRRSSIAISRVLAHFFGFERYHSSSHKLTMGHRRASCHLRRFSAGALHHAIPK